MKKMVMILFAAMLTLGAVFASATPARAATPTLVTPTKKADTTTPKSAANGMKEYAEGFGLTAKTVSGTTWYELKVFSTSGDYYRFRVKKGQIWQVRSDGQWKSYSKKELKSWIKTYAEKKIGNTVKAIIALDDMAAYVKKFGLVVESTSTGGKTNLAKITVKGLTGSSGYPYLAVRATSKTATSWYVIESKTKKSKLTTVAARKYVKDFANSLTLGNKADEAIDSLRILAKKNKWSVATQSAATVSNGYVWSTLEVENSKYTFKMRVGGKTTATKLTYEYYKGSWQSCSLSALEEVLKNY